MGESGRCRHQIRKEDQGDRGRIGKRYRWIIIEHESRETAIDYIKEILSGKTKDIESRIIQEKEDIRIQMDMVRELLSTERQRREDSLMRIREDQEGQEKSLKDRMERLENESREFFGKMEGYLEGGVSRVQEEVDVFRKQLMAESEKVAELVRKEIEARFSSDV